MRARVRSFRMDDRGWGMISENERERVDVTLVRASLEWTAEGGCPHICVLPADCEKLFTSMTSMGTARTLFEKIWDAHLVAQPPGRSPILYIDLHLVHEVTSPQAFDGLRAAGRKVRQTARTVATVDHNIPTEPRGTPITDLIAAKQISALQNNCKEFGIRLFDMDSPEQGIVHVIGPELGLTQPGMTIVCGDSHTSTHGAFGALAFGIGTSEVEHVLATQCLAQQRPKTMKIDVRGTFGRRRKRERPGTGDYRADWNGRRHRVRDGIRRARGARALDGRSHDAVQYEYRSGSAGWDGGAG